MTLASTLNHYRILGRLGGGGMGDVYAAEDTRLNRKVAIKVISGLMATDPDRRQRFAREAQAIAAFNHPNIVTIYSVEEADGVPFLTMELIEGRPLNEVIPAGGMPLDMLLRHAMAIADALAAAQQRGIIHRDLKPANVMVTSEGRVKVLDFGLAKLRESEQRAASEDLTRMATRELTGEGKIIGTVAYMSPEQAEGKPVDSRSDIFSFGVLLHEMATGDRPFKGDTNVSVISSILKDTPSSITDLNPTLPVDLARIVRRCLAKDPSRRYQTAADLRNELEDLSQDTQSGIITSDTRRPKPRRRFTWIATALGGLAIAALVLFGIGRMSRSAAQPTGLAIDHFTRLTAVGTVSRAALSPDGRYVVHVKGEGNNPSLWVRQTATSSDVQIVAPAPVAYDGVAFAPDGNYVYYSTYARPGVATLYRIPVLGGTPSLVITDIDSPISFSPDQRQFAFMRGSPEKGITFLMIANADGSNVRDFTSLSAPDKFQNESPSWSPDGKTILATATRRGLNAGVFAIDARSAAATPIGGDWGFMRNVQWLPDGRSFLIDAIDLSGSGTNTQIWRVLYPSGERTRVTNDLNSYNGVSVSADGRSIATAQTEITAGIDVVSLQGGDWKRLTAGVRRADGVGGMTWLPDGRLVFSSIGAGLPQLWIVDADEGSDRQLGTINGAAGWPFATADGRWIYFQATVKEGICIFRMAPDGSGLQQITARGDEINPIVSPDSRTIYFTGLRSGTPHPFKVRSEGGDPVSLGDAFFRAIAISPDGARLLGQSWDSANRRPAIGLLSIDGGAVQLLPGTPLSARFTPDGRSFVYPDLNKRPISLWITPIAGGAPRQIGKPIPDLVFNGVVSRDGRIAISHGTQTSDLVLITMTTTKVP